MILIRLTLVSSEHDGDQFYMNAEDISSIWPTDTGSVITRRAIEGYRVRVRESPREIADQIDRMQRA